MKGKLFTAAAIGAAAFGVLIWQGAPVYTGSVFAGQAQEQNAKAVATEPNGAEKEKGMLAALNRKEKELAAREEEIAKKEQRLAAIKADVDSRIAELQKTHDSIEAYVKKINEINDERNKKVVRIYEAMPPEEAASRIEKLDDESAVMILAAMSERKAAKILGAIETNKAAKLSKAFKVKN